MVQEKYTVKSSDKFPQWEFRGKIDQNNKTYINSYIAV